MNGFIDFFTDVTVAAAVTTASHFGIAIEGVESKAPPAAAQRTVRRTAVGSSASKPAPRSVRAAN